MTRKAARAGEAPDLADLERRLGHKFGNPELARQALTHRSFGAPHNERLEFLQASLSEVAVQMGLGDRLRLGEGELKSGGFRRPSILADSLEALLGAVFLDAGFEATRGAVAHLFAGKLENAGNKPVDKDPKTALQEHLQGRGLALPRYAVQKTEGEAHDQTFTVECRVDDLGLVASGRGASRRAAEQAAAEGVLAQLEKAPRRRKS